MEIKYGINLGSKLVTKMGYVATSALKELNEVYPKLNHALPSFFKQYRGSFLSKADGESWKVIIQSQSPKINLDWFTIYLRWEFLYNQSGYKCLQITGGNNIKSIESAGYPKLNSLPDLLGNYLFRQYRIGFFHMIYIVDYPHFRYEEFEELNNLPE